MKDESQNILISNLYMVILYKVCTPPTVISAFEISRKKQGNNKYSEVKANVQTGKQRIKTSQHMSDN